MAVLVNVRVCDVCKRVGVETRRYTVTEGGRAAETDRCADHGKVLEQVLEAEYPQVDGGESVTRDATPGESPESRKTTEPSRKSAAKKPVAPATRAVAKKTAAKKAQSARRPKIMTIDEIEQAKRK
ncbi:MULTISPECIES: hypothetical protein [unclassified Streptomyces]|uniref:hypothetical protein n=1 Tax=unclassified Streptomyces TaxID=2593676 RepID=UPI00036261FF|nr:MULTISPECIES: hypothetical protein [unclassified Streptomyces]MYT31762.1 hypothetical protein [Streptomyces sp. SID8354]